MLGSRPLTNSFLASGSPSEEMLTSVFAEGFMEVGTVRRCCEDRGSVAAASGVLVLSQPAGQRGVGESSSIWGMQAMYYVMRDLSGPACWWV